MKLPTHIVMSMLLLFIMAGSLFLVWSFFIDGKIINPPMTFESTYLQTDKLEYKAGEIVYVHMSFCKNRAMQGTIQWQLIDTYIRFYPQRFGSVAVGCREITAEAGKITPDAYTDTYHFEALLTYDINSFNRVTIPLITNEFKVTR